MSNNTKQLYKKSSDGSYPKIFPLAFIQGIKDKRNDKELLSYINEINHFKVDYNENPETTRCQVDVYLRKKGLYITYYNTDIDETVTEYFKGNQSDVTDDSIWGDSDNWELVPDKTYIENHAVIPDESINMNKLADDVIQAIGDSGLSADEEDITDRNGILKFKDKEYNIEEASGLGYKILRKNWVEDKNILTQDMINEANTIYEIKYDFELSEDITIPSNCVLNFNGGSISGIYILSCDNTLFTGNIISKVNLAGTLANKEICINEFLDNQSILDYQRINNVLSTLNYAKVNFNGNYISVDTESESLNRGIRLVSNIIYSGNGSIINYPNSKSSFIFNDAHNYDGIDYVENIVIDGFNFSCGLHSENSGSHHFATIALGRVKDCRISNCTFNNWIGDAIAAAYVFNPQRTAHVKGFTENIVIDNCNFLGTGTGDNWKERNVVSVLDCDGFTISNCLFKDMGNPNQPSCIDFEPEKIGGVNVMNVKRVIIKGCNFLNVQAGAGNISFVGSAVTIDPEYIIIRDNVFKGGKEGIRLSLDFKYSIISNMFNSMINSFRIDKGNVIINNNTFELCSGESLIGYTLDIPTVNLNNNIFKNCIGTNNRVFIIHHISGLLFCENNYIESCRDNGGDIKYGLITSISLNNQEDSENNNIIFIDNIFFVNNSNFIGIYKTASIRKIKDLNTKIVGWDGTPGYYTPNMALDSTQIICKD